MNYTPAQLHEILKNLPLDVNEAIGSVDYVDTLISMEKKYRLHIDQMDALGSEVYKLMLGLTPPQQFIDMVKTSVNVSDETAKQIATEVNAKILRPVRESLIQIHQMDVAEESVQPVIDNTAVPAGEIPEPPKKTTPDPYRETV